MRFITALLLAAMFGIASAQAGTSKNNTHIKFSTGPSPIFEMGPGASLCGPAIFRTVDGREITNLKKGECYSVSQPGSSLTIKERK